MNKWTSRKLVVSTFSVAMNIFLPIMFKALEIDPNVTLASMGAIAAVTSSYLITNVQSKKYGQNTGDSN